MKAPEFVEALSATLGESVIDVRAVDRSLADAGMRSKGRGVNAPDETVVEGMRTVLGLMGSRNYTRAHRDVRRLEALPCRGSTWPTTLDFEAMEAIVTDVFGAAMRSVEGFTALDALVAIASAFNRSRGSSVQVTVEVSESLVEVRIEFGASNASVMFGDGGQGAIRRTSSIGRADLAWIDRVLSTEHSVAEISER